MNEDQLSILELPGRPLQLLLAVLMIRAGYPYSIQKIIAIYEIEDEVQSRIYFIIIIIFFKSIGRALMIINTHSVGWKIFQYLHYVTGNVPLINFDALIVKISEFCEIIKKI